MGDLVMSDNKRRVIVSNNFLENGTSEVDLEAAMSGSYVYFDARNDMLSYDSSFADNTWYFNYIKSNVNFAARNPKAYPSYLLDLGYVPVVFLPSCCSQQAVTMINVLDQKGYPYIKTGAYSFVKQRAYLDYMDAWMSKLDIERIFGIPLFQITSEEVIRRIYGD